MYPIQITPQARFESASGSALRGLTAPWWLHQNQEDRDAAVTLAWEWWWVYGGRENSTGF